MASCSWRELANSQAVLRGIRDAGLRDPAPVQTATVPIASFGIDLIAQAKSGTGKTAAYAIVALNMIRPNKAGPQALLVAPTREIAAQTAHVCRIIASHADGVRVATFIGGTPEHVDVRAAGRCELACGTPGRLVSLLLSGALDAERVRLLVLDEADKLAEPEFEPQLRYLLTALPERKQVLAFSATYPPALLATLRKHMRSPQVVSVLADGAGGGDGDNPHAGVAVFGLGEGDAAERTTAIHADMCLERVRQFYALVAPSPADAGDDGIYVRPKWCELVRLLDALTFHQALIFAAKGAESAALARHLSAAGFPSGFISADRSQAERSSVVRRFRDFELRLLVASDLLARGVDFGRVTLVVHLSAPHDVPTYLHRVGRTGRFGARGISVLLLDPGEWARFRRLADGENIAPEHLDFGTEAGASVLQCELAPEPLSESEDSARLARLALLRMSKSKS